MHIRFYLADAYYSLVYTYIIVSHSRKRLLTLLLLDSSRYLYVFLNAFYKSASSLSPFEVAANRSNLRAPSERGGTKFELPKAESKEGNISRVKMERLYQDNWMKLTFVQAPPLSLSGSFYALK